MIDPSWLIIILLSILILQASYLIVRKPKVVIDPNAISAIIGNALSEVVGRVSGEIGRAIGKLEEFDRNLSVTRETLPENVRKYISELRNDLVEFRNELNSLPESVLRSIQGSIDVRKGKVGELATLMRLLGQYDRIIPLGKPVDFIGIGEYIDFIETKTGSSNLTEEQRRIRDLIRSRKVRFIVRREDVEVITPEEVLESPQSASEVLKEVGVGEG
jgi:predicted Holliday junction resolvase-like endonuclease